MNTKVSSLLHNSWFILYLLQQSLNNNTLQSALKALSLLETFVMIQFSLEYSKLIKQITDL